MVEKYENTKGRLMETAGKGLTEFIKQTFPGKKGKLEPFEKEILFLDSKGYTCGQIAKFLQTQNVNTVPQNIRHFLKTKNVNNKETENQGDKDGN